MKSGMKPAQLAVHLGGDSAKLSSNTNNKGIFSVSDANCQPRLWPNYCRHFPDRPRFFAAPASHKPRALTIQETIKRLYSSYFNPNKELRTLQLHLDTTGHQVRSERREAVISLLSAMTYYVDDATGRVGRLLDNGIFKDLTIKKLANYAHLRLKRAKRAMKDIVRAGYLKVTRQYDRLPDGSFLALPSIREFTPKFFMELEVKGELWVKWFANKTWKKEKEIKKVTKLAKARARAAVGIIKEGLNTFSAGTKNRMDKVAGIIKRVTKPKQVNIDYEKQMIKMALEMFNLDPSRSHTEYLRELKIKYPPPD